MQASSSNDADLDRAFARAKTEHGLTERGELKDALDGGHITATTKVHSLVSTFPDYVLGNVVGRHGLRGVAMFTLADPAHPEFAGMTTSDVSLGHFPLVNPREVQVALGNAGLQAVGKPDLVWGWSAETNSPYYPMWRIQTNVGLRYVTSMGQVIENPDLQAPARS